MRIIRPLALFAGAVLAQLASAQDTLTPAQTPAIAATPPQLPCCLIPAGTYVDIEITDSLNSKTSLIGAMFGIKTTSSIKIGDAEVIPAGAIGQGQIIHAAKARAAGKPGELIIAARYIEHEGIRIPLRSFRYGPSSGKNNSDEALAAAVIIASPLALIIVGGQVNVPSNTKAHAKVAADTQIPQIASETKAAPPAHAELPVSNGGKVE